MLKDIKNLIETIEQSEEYKNWKMDNANAFLTNVFTMFEDINAREMEWQLHYYNPDSQKLSSFIKIKGNIIVKKDQDFVKQDEMKKLNLEDAKEELEDLLTKIKVRYHNQKIEKIIVVLYTNEDILWNITLLTSIFNVINVKVNAITGEFIKDELKSAMSFKL